MIVLAGRIDSSSEPVPAEHRDRLKAILDRINREKGETGLPFRITGREFEFQAGYDHPRHMFDHIWLIMYELYPLTLFFSIGLEEHDSVSGHQDGGRLHYQAVRHAIRGLEQLGSTRSLITVVGYTGAEKNLIDLSLQLISDAVKRWKRKRFAVLYGLSREREIGEISDLLNISERSVYKNIRAGSLETVLATVNEIGRLIGESRSADASG